MVARYIPTVMAIGAFLAAYKLFGLEEYIYPPLTHGEIQKEYDYVIVGAGTTGAVLASRLSENSTLDILLLEAGGEETEDENVDIPIMTDKVRGSDLDWSYRTVPQRHACKGHEDQVSIWPSGKGLGGTSNINYMQYLRGSRHDFDEWAHNGAHGWSYKDVLPYFIKSEDNRNAEFTRTVFHGFGGRLTVTDIELSPVTRIMSMAFNELGVKRRDINGRSQYGYGHTQATIRFGVRQSVAKAFLRQAMMRSNLHVSTNSPVTKILFDGKKASGVTFKRDDKQFVVKAKKEVILCAGTIGSAKLLLLSGIGPRGHLQSVKIPVVADLPVGDNLQDHVMSAPLEFYSPFEMSITLAKSENFASAWAYSLFGAGLKQSPRFREGTAFVRTRHQPPHIKYPLIGLHVVASLGAYSHSHVNTKKELWEAIYGKPPSKEGFSIFPILLHPRSRGTLRLRSKEPEDEPLINPNYLMEDPDVKYLVEAIKYARKLVDTQVMKDWEITASQAVLPECAKKGEFTDAYWECFVRTFTLSGYSPVGTARMGAVGDPTAVVDYNLKVRGIKKLRVADASIIPNAISGNTYATQIMIGEKLADILMERNSVHHIQEYFKHLIAVKHEKMRDEEEHPGEHGTEGSKKKKK